MTIKGSQGPRFGPVLVIPFIPNPDLHHHSLAFPIAPSTRPLNAGIPLSLLICTARQSRGCTHSEFKGPIRCADQADKHQPVRPPGPNPTQPKDLRTRAKHFPWGLKLHARKATEQARSDTVEQSSTAPVKASREACGQCPAPAGTSSGLGGNTVLSTPFILPDSDTDPLRKPIVFVINWPRNTHRTTV